MKRRIGILMLVAIFMGFSQAQFSSSLESYVNMPANISQLDWNLMDFNLR